MCGSIFEHCTRITFVMGAFTFTFVLFSQSFTITMRSILMPAQASKLLVLVLAFLTVSSVFLYLIVSASSFRSSFERHLPSAWKAKPTNNYAFSFFLAGPVQELQNDNDDHNFVATRMIIY